MREAQTKFGARAERTEDVIKLYITVVPFNTQVPMEKVREISLENLTGSFDDVERIVEGYILEMWDEIVLSMVRSAAVAAVLRELNQK